MASSGSGDRPAPDDAVRRRLRERATTIRDEQVARALDRLERKGGLAPAERDAVAAMADAIVADLLAPPERAMTAGDGPERRAVAAAVADLFDLSTDAVAPHEAGHSTMGDAGAPGSGVIDAAPGTRTDSRH